MSDLSIKLRQNTHNRDVKCRYLFDEPCLIKKDEHYVSINGWGSGGPVTLAICEKHCDAFMQQVEALIKEYKKMKRQNRSGKYKSTDRSEK